MTATMASDGLRERKKQQTRLALSQAAMNLALEHGVARLRTEDIAAAANVSMRTFNNYFPSKEAAIVASVDHRIDAIRSALADRPLTEAVELSLQIAVLSSFPEWPDRSWLAQVMLMRNHPTLIQEQHRADLGVMRELAAMIADRSAVGDRDLFPTLLASMLVTAVRVAIEHWIEAGGDGSLHDAISDALARITVARETG
jgi:AcrR family transcriptional regulator